MRPSFKAWFIIQTMGLNAVSKKHIFLTGRPGVGKSTVVKKVLGISGIRAGGFFTEEIREGGARVGFAIEDILTGSRRVMAHVRFKGPCRVGRYGVDVSAIDSVGISALEGAEKERVLVVVDEIGVMELFSPKFEQWVERLIGMEGPVFAVVQQRREDLLARLKSRDDAEVIVVTEGNRNALQGLIASKLR